MEELNQNEWKEILRWGQWWQRRKNGCTVHMFTTLYIVECSIYTTNKKQIECEFGKKINKPENWKMKRKNVYAHDWEEFIMMLCQCVCVVCINNSVHGFDGCVKRLRFDNNVYIVVCAVFFSLASVVVVMDFSISVYSLVISLSPVFSSVFTISMYKHRTFFFCKWNSSNVKYVFHWFNKSISIERMEWWLQ